LVGEEKELGENGHFQERRVLEGLNSWAEKILFIWLEGIFINGLGRASWPLGRLKKGGY